MVWVKGSQTWVWDLVGACAPGIYTVTAVVGPTNHSLALEPHAKATVGRGHALHVQIGSVPEIAALVQTARPGAVWVSRNRHRSERDRSIPSERRNERGRPAR